MGESITCGRGGAYPSEWRSLRSPSGLAIRRYSSRSVLPDDYNSASRSRGNNGTPRNEHSSPVPRPSSSALQHQVGRDSRTYPSPSNITVGIAQRSARGSWGSTQLTRLGGSERYCGMGQKWGDVKGFIDPFEGIWKGTDGNVRFRKAKWVNVTRLRGQRVQKARRCARRSEDSCHHRHSACDRHGDTKIRRLENAKGKLFTKCENHYRTSS